jgi:hypothetical protein
LNIENEKYFVSKNRGAAPLSDKGHFWEFTLSDKEMDFKWQEMDFKWQGPFAKQKFFKWQKSGHLCTPPLSAAIFCYLKSA